MKVKIIKGTNQIGGCITEISCKDTKIIIDFGTDLNDNNEEFELEGLTKGASRYNAVFVTHSHGDHIGLINKINKDIPVYVEKESLIIHNLTCDFTNKEPINRKVNTFEIEYNKKKEDKSKRIIFENQDLKVSAYNGDHSSYNSCMFLIEGDGKKVLHTGDFRTHGRRSKTLEISLRKIGKVDLLISEGTTLTRFTKNEVKFPTEKELEIEVDKIMNKYDQVFIMQSSTNLDRTVTFGRSTLKSGKTFILDLLSYYINEYCTNFFQVDYENVFVWIPYKYKYKSEEFKLKYLNIETSSKISPYYAMEVKESMLPDIKKLYDKGLIKNACFIYSMWNGYIEKEDKLNNFIKELEKMNIKFIKLHTSGHIDIVGMKMVNRILNPDATIIIHTEDKTLGKDIYNNVIDLNDGSEYIV